MELAQTHRAYAIYTVRICFCSIFTSKTLSFVFFFNYYYFFFFFNEYTVLNIAVHRQYQYKKPVYPMYFVDQIKINMCVIHKHQGEGVERGLMSATLTEADNVARP